MDSVLVVGAWELWESLIDFPDNNLDIKFLHGVHQAKEMLADQNIIMLVLDCNVSGTDEFELLRWTQSVRPELECILLVHPSDFCKVPDYKPQKIYRIIKPATAAEVKHIILRTKLKLEHVALEGDMRSPIVRRHQEKQFWSHLLQGMIGAEEHALLAASPPAMFDFRGRQQVLPILLTHRGWRKKHSSQEMDALRFGAKTVSDKMLTNRFGGISFSYHPNSLLVLIYESPGCSSNDVLPLEQCCRQLSDVCFDSFDSSIACYYGHWCLAHELPAQVEILWAGDRDNIMNLRGISSIEQITNHRDPFTPPQPRNWMFYFNEGRQDEFCRCAEEYFNQAIASGTMTGRLLAVFQQDFLQEIFFALKELGIPASSLYNGSDFNSVMIDTRRSVTAMLEWVREITGQAIELMNISNTNRSIATRVCKYVDCALNRQITRQEISKALFLSTGHIARAFKEEMGISISDYITRQRVSLACRMLQQTEMTPGIVSERAGFQEYSHFYKTFIREQGVSPSEYQKRMQ